MADLNQVEQLLQQARGEDGIQKQQTLLNAVIKFNEWLSRDKSEREQSSGDSSGDSSGESKITPAPLNPSGVPSGEVPVGDLERDPGSDVQADESSLNDLIEMLGGLMTGGSKNGYQVGGAQLTGDAKVYEDIVNNFKNKLISQIKSFASDMKSKDAGKGAPLVNFLNKTWVKYTNNKLTVYNLAGEDERIAAKQNFSKTIPGRIEILTEPDTIEIGKEKVDDFSLLRKLPNVFEKQGVKTINAFLNLDGKIQQTSLKIVPKNY
jgi:hypothetical protein